MARRPRTLKTDLSNREARSIALAAQGFADRPPAGRVDSRHFDRLFDRVKVVQLDSVNVAVRTHYMPAFSRLGPYPRERFDAYAYGRRRLFEAWGHVASLLPVEHYPLLRHRMEDARSRSIRSFGQERRAYVEEICREVAERGPLAVSDLRDQGRNRSRPWWGRSDGKLALEWLFATGRLAASRRGNFTRVYDLAERVIPAAGAGRAGAGGRVTRSGSCCAWPPARTASVTPPTSPTTTASACRRLGRSCSELVEEGELLEATVSKAGAGPPTCTATRARRGGSTPAPCSARSTR